MAHMTSLGSGCDDGSCSGGTFRLVTYTATGAEGVDFSVPIGATLAAAGYEVGLFGTAGVTNAPVLDFPTGSGDRTTSTFRVLSAAVLTAGDVFKFQILE